MTSEPISKRSQQRRSNLYHLQTHIKDPRLVSCRISTFPLLLRDRKLKRECPFYMWSEKCDRAPERQAHLRLKSLQYKFAPGILIVVAMTTKVGAKGCHLGLPKVNRVLRTSVKGRRAFEPLSHAFKTENNPAPTASIFFCPLLPFLKCIVETSSPLWGFGEL
ncbi:hypothetical protein AVEN_125645-1 [Araneus ventricosus]|uniref:Uncharacterized protein n=1 Tax=Araneus ventricosus TaxID=182803 RepID=A0A4Y2N991_ARAVE|nr:hypothetical protein AVEN_125645-1 [Araneus ventricosus]